MTRPKLNASWVKVAGRPVCWDWPVTDVALLLAARATTAKAAAEALWAWQRGCAICGDTDSWLVLDHDHHTRLIRGYLCKGCNTGEGSRTHNEDSVFLNYRHINPAYILSLEFPYTHTGSGKRRL